VVPERAKPVPVRVALLIVTGPVPVELKIRVFVAAVLTATLPNTRLVVLAVNVGVGAFS